MNERQYTVKKYPSVQAIYGPVMATQPWLTMTGAMMAHSWQTIDGFPHLGQHWFLYGLPALFPKLVIHKWTRVGIKLAKPLW